MHKSIEGLHQELKSCVTDFWNPIPNVQSIQIRPGWLVAYNHDHPCHTALVESLTRLQQRFSPEELTILASDMYFNPLWWRQAVVSPHFHWEYERSADNYLVAMLEVWIVEHPPADIHQRFESRLRQMFQHPYDSPEISLAAGSGSPPDYYLPPNVDHCLAMLPLLKPTPALLDLAERILTGEFNYGPIHINAYTPDDMSYRMYWMAGRFHDLFTYLCENGCMSYDIFRKASLSTRSIVTTLSFSPYRRQVLKSGEQCTDQIEEYKQRMLDEVSQQLSEDNYKIILETDLPLRGAAYLLRAAENHARLKAGILSVRIHLPDTVEDALIRLARVEGTEPETEAQRHEVVEQLRHYPAATLEALLPISFYSYPLLCEALGWENAYPLIEQIIQISDLRHAVSNIYGHWQPPDVPNSADATSGVIDIAAVKNALTTAGEPLAQKVLDVYGKAQVGVNNTITLIRAVAGWNQEQVKKGLQKHGQISIKAYGLLPLQEGQEEILERYIALRQSAKNGQKFGQMRRASHAGAVQVALANLAKVAGYPDATRLEWAMEAKIAQDVTSPERSWTVGDYTMQLQIKGAEAALSISRAGKILKSVPKDVRNSPDYKEAQNALTQFRAQASRLKNGLLEGCLASGEALTLEELNRLLQLPSAQDMMQRLVFRKPDGKFGLLVAEEMVLRDLHGEEYPVETEIIIAHPYDLFQANMLAAWQHEIIHQRIVQPVKQVFRELYLLTPAEQATHTFSNRFAGHVIDGAVAARLFGTRGWRVANGDVPLPYKIFPGIQAIFELPDAQHFLGGGYPITTDRIYFEPYPNENAGRRFPEEIRLPLEQIPPLIFSEVMRDADLIVSVAQREGEARLSNEVYDQRGDLVKALLDDLGLPGVTIDGHFAYVQGKRARYRVHLGSAVIHIEPGNYLCIVPDRWGQQHEKLFLPFADEKDAKISEVISKILLLLADDQIKDESILRQIRKRSD